MSIDDHAAVDHHCHGVIGSDLDVGAFEQLITESYYPPAPGTTYFDSPLALAIRRWCAPLLDLDPGVDIADYISRRNELGATEANRRLMSAARAEALLVETGYRADEILGLDELAALAGAATHEVVRLEAVAESVARRGVGAEEYPTEFEEALEQAAVDAVGLKSTVAYRGGFAFAPAAPSRAEVIDAAGRWLKEVEAADSALRDPTLLRFGLWTGVDLARERGLPLQFHCGYGDPDLTLHLADPSLLTGFIREVLDLDVAVTLLHCYPYHRQAAYLAAVFPHVYFDVGLAVNFVGPSCRRIVAEAMELAPLSKHLYSSDAFGLAELYCLGSLLFRRALRAVLDGWIADDYISATEADDAAGVILAGNARRIYPLEVSSAC